ncbi:MAG TPA: nucleotide exchange factor GrpE [Streptosporangiaceae bacterium]|nr:nucleotide exchange factor GrpE [Streptosporangiaceae bacterium]
MNRLRLAIRVLIRGPAVVQPAPGRPEHQTARSAEAQQQRDADLNPVSESTRQLIALRDSVQAAVGELDAPGSQALNAVARQLAQILAAEQVIPIEDSGAFDARRHHAVASMETDDAALDYQVASNVRSGYLSSGTLLRRQDVIVYRLTGDHG